MGFTMRVFVDPDHAGDKITRRSRTWFFIYLQSALLYWTSKKQTTIIETSSFRSEFMAIKHATEQVCGLRYELRAMGIPMEGCAYIFGDSHYVLANTTTPHSHLKRKSNSIAYHHCQEGSALDEWRTVYIKTHDNLSNILTKNILTGEKIFSFANSYCTIVLLRIRVRRQILLWR